MDNVCPRCGTRITGSLLSLREIVLAVVWTSLLLSILVPAFWTTEKWFERQEHQIMDRMSWHEPLDDWNQ